MSNMNHENIINYVPTLQDGLHITALSFVYENNSVKRTHNKTQGSVDYFCLGLVTRGEGILHSTKGAFPLYRGTLFIKIPNVPYRIENVFDLQYIYIAYMENHACSLLDRISFRESMPVWDGFDLLIPLWESTVKTCEGAGMDLAVEGLLLYSFSKLCHFQKTESVAKTTEKETKHMLRVKQYIDCHYTESDLNLEKVSDIFSYNYKYLSHEFKKNLGISFTQYLNNLRLKNAKQLIDCGMCSVTDIALQSGYRDTMYFSKLFHKFFGLSPKEYINRVIQNADIHPMSDNNIPEE